MIFQSGVVLSVQERLMLLGVTSPETVRAEAMFCFVGMLRLPFDFQETFIFPESSDSRAQWLLKIKNKNNIYIFLYLSFSVSLDVLIVRALKKTSKCHSDKNNETPLTLDKHVVLMIPCGTIEEIPQ